MGSRCKGLSNGRVVLAWPVPMVGGKGMRVSDDWLVGTGCVECGWSGMKCERS